MKMKQTLCLCVASLLGLGLLLPRASSLVAPRRCSQLLRKRTRSSSRYRCTQRACSWSSFEDEAASTTAIENGDRYERYHYQARAPPSMVPLSRPPLLLLKSSAPIVSRDACALLSRYFDAASRVEPQQAVRAEALLRSLHDVIDDVTHCPRHDGETPLPRYVRYEPTTTEAAVLRDPTRLGAALLPDGLHVDTNNGQLFRHVTAILYLTDAPRRETAPPGARHEARGGTPRDRGIGVAGGGTTFPLAVPPEKKRSHDRAGHKLREAASRLLERGIAHTKGDVSEHAASEGRVLETAGLDVFYGDNADYLPGLAGEHYNYSVSAKESAGVRVMPEAGKLIYFHNVDDAGLPDPRSFHGGEELLAPLPAAPPDAARHASRSAAGIEKSILVFFKEIPVHAFRDRGREGFAAEARRSRSRTQERYF